MDNNSLSEVNTGPKTKLEDLQSFDGDGALSSIVSEAHL
jgi:hypothetical protein